MLEDYKIGICHALEIPQLPPLINDLADREYFNALADRPEDVAQLAMMPDGGRGFWIQVGYNGGMEMLDTLQEEGIEPEDYGLLMLPE